MNFRDCSWITWLKIQGFLMNFTPLLSGLGNNTVAGNLSAVSVPWKSGDKGSSLRESVD